MSFLANEIRELLDPRLHGVTLTGVDMSPDLKVARIHWAFHREGDTAVTQKNVEEGLQNAKGLLRRRIGDELELRYVPELVFRYDTSIETGFRIDELLNKARDGR